MNYYIAESQFDFNDLDCPSIEIIIDSLANIEDELDPEGVWTYMGSYKLHYWIDENKPNDVFCNAFVLKDPEDENSTETYEYGYYFEITRG